MPLSLDLVLKVARLLSAVLVVVASAWGFFLPPTYPSWLLSAFTLVGVAVVLIGDIPKVSDHPRIKELLAWPLGTMLRRSIVLLFIGLMTPRDLLPVCPPPYYNYHYGPYCIAAGVIFIFVALVHFALWLFVYRKEEQLQSTGAPPALPGAGHSFGSTAAAGTDGVVEPVGGYAPSVPQDNSFAAYAPSPTFGQPPSAPSYGYSPSQGPTSL